MFNLLISLSIFFLYFFHSLGGQTSFTHAQAGIFGDAQYTSVDWRDFERLPEVHRSISLQFPDYSLLNAAVMYATNKVREKYGLTPLEFSPKLRDMAVFHSKEMARLRFVGHYNRTNNKMYSMDERSEYFRANAYSENVANFFVFNYDSGARYYATNEGETTRFFLNDGTLIVPHSYWSFAEALVNAWMNSPGHRENILDPDIETIGAGIALDPGYPLHKDLPMAYCTQNFGK